MSDEQISAVALEFEQRQRANNLEKAVSADPLAAAFEIVFLRCRCAELERRVQLARVSLEGKFL